MVREMSSVDTQHALPEPGTHPTRLSFEELAANSHDGAQSVPLMLIKSTVSSKLNTGLSKPTLFISHDTLRSLLKSTRRTLYDCYSRSDMLSPSVDPLLAWRNTSDRVADDVNELQDWG